MVITDSTRKRFWAKVRKTRGCWIWTGARNGNYGQVRVNGRHVAAHRLARMLDGKRIGIGKCVLHKCDTPLCVRPFHLWTGTDADNMADKVRKGRTAFGVTMPQSKLTPARVREMRRLRVSGVTFTALARMFGVYKSTTAKVIHRHTWKQVA